jgi:predicted flap endonuclease-1-like 5' DNA nuclease
LTVYWQQADTNMTGKKASKARKIAPRQVGDLPDGLSAPAHRALAGAGIARLAQLAKLSEAEVKKLHGLGPNGIAKLKAALQSQGLAFAKDKN